MRHDFSMKDDLRFELVLKRNSNREVIAQALCRDFNAVNDFLNKQIEILGIGEDGNAETGNTYTVVSAEYNVKTKEYMFTKSVNFMLRKPTDGNFPSGRWFGTFESPHIYNEEDITSNVNLSKKRAEAVDRIVNFMYQYPGFCGDFYTIFFKDGTSEDCNYKNEFNNLIDKHMKAA